MVYVTQGALADEPLKHDSARHEIHVILTWHAACDVAGEETIMVAAREDYS